MTGTTALTLGSAPGPVLHLLTLGACVHRLEVTGGDGRRRDVVLGHDTPEQRLAATEFHGAVIGRYANRIAYGDLPLPTGRVSLPTNDRGHHLHGGPDGFHRREWELESHDERSARFALTSPDGDQGYPGTLRATATYRVSDDAVEVELAATTDAVTVVGLTQHSYFNLGGVGTGTIDDHHLRLGASRFTPVDATGIPLGEHEDVAGTPFDLRESRRLGDVLRTPHPQLADARGIDHNVVLDPPAETGAVREAAVLDHPASRTRLTLSTDRAGLQVYTGNFLDASSVGHGGVPHRQGDGIALEPQGFPDSPHHPEWPSVVLEPGQEWRSRLVWRFSAL
ncbi:aldose epimerase family protein [Nocardioides sp. CFH 31398]|uniref:aldose epimerase family protein n=1 Tax=Nocardioides sp. CFH 31398 TaxID=2919579 RepID=UPI001F06113F|nr:aldose epimerase family protein [Nocardioides sp. CFH 31398]MCH1866086.1 galactose mutarotase [Nocardioides sp. CFH 31398]